MKSKAGSLRRPVKLISLQPNGSGKRRHKSPKSGTEELAKLQIL